MDGVMTRISASLWVLVLALGVSPARAETLKEAMATAYTSNPTLDAQRAALRATDEDVAKALSGWRPTVVVSGSAGYSHVRVKGGIIGGGGTTASDDLQPKDVQIQATQPVYRGGRTIAETSAAENRVQSGQAQLSDTEQTVLLDVVQAYVGVLRDQAVLELTDKNVAVLRRELEAANDRFDVGEITRTDVAQSQARLAASLADRSQAEADLNASRQAYERVVGHMPGTLVADYGLPPLPATLDEAQATATADNPRLASARYAEAAARDNIDVARSALLPQVSVVGAAASAKDQSFSGGRTDQYSVTAQVSIPLYQSGAEYATIRQNQQVASQALAQISEAQRAVIEGVSNAWSQLTAVRASIVSLDEAVQANDLALEGVRQESSVGSRTVLDVLNAERELLDSRVSLVRAKASEVTAAFSLLSAMGRLTAQSLALSVEPYQPSAHYDATRDRWIGVD